MACGLLVVVATRRAPHLSPDSMTYLSAAAHLRSGLALSDFTGEPLTVFPPLYPLMLAPGGTSLLWVRIVGALSVAAATLLMSVALRRRVRPLAAVAGAVAFGASQGLLRVASAAWSEAPYAAISLGMIVVLGTTRMTPRVAALGGMIAGLGFLTRYAGIGLAATGSGDGRRRSRAAMPAASWWRERWPGAPFGGCICRRSRGRRRRVGHPQRRAHGRGVRAAVRGWRRRGPDDPARPAVAAIGELVVGERPSDAVARVVGLVAVVALATAAAVVSRRRPVHPLDAGMVVFAATSLVVPVVARAAHGERHRVPRDVADADPARVRRHHRRRSAVAPAHAVAIAGALLASLVVLHGVLFAAQFPDRAHLSTGYRGLHAPALYDVVDELPADVTVLTNYPQGLWWQTRREPTLFAFTRPRPGQQPRPAHARRDRRTDLRPNHLSRLVRRPPQRW